MRLSNLKNFFNVSRVRVASLVHTYGRKYIHTHIQDTHTKHIYIGKYIEQNAYERMRFSICV